MNSLLCNFLKDWGVSIKDSIGETGVLICIIVFACLAFMFFAGICMRAIKKVNKDKKLKIYWLQIIFIIIFVLLTVWFATIL